MKNLIYFLAFVFALPLAAQVQLGGHVYVPSSTDSTNGLAIVTFTTFAADTVCIVSTQSNCTVTSASGAAFDPSLPYVGAYDIEDGGSLLGNGIVVLPQAPGRIFHVANNTAQPIGISDPAGDYVETVFPGTSLTYWLDENDVAHVVTGCASRAGSNGNLVEFSTASSPCDVENSPIDDGVTNPGFLTSAESLVFPYVVNSSFSVSSFAGSDITSSGIDSRAFVAVANIHDIAGGGSSATGTLFNLNVAAAAISLTTPDSNSPACVDLWADSGFGDPVLVQTAEFCDGSIQFNEPVQPFNIVGSDSGVATLAAGTATVSTAAACTPGNLGCVYTLTNCGLNGTAVIGVPSVGTVVMGTSFVINSLTALAAVSADTSLVCWKIK
jgi:hypothetical protein